MYKYAKPTNTVSQEQNNDSEVVITGLVLDQQ